MFSSIGRKTHDIIAHKLHQSVIHQNPPRPSIGPIFILLYVLVWFATLVTRTGLELAAGMEQHVFVIFPSVPRAGTPSTLPQTRHCSIVI